MSSTNPAHSVNPPQSSLACFECGKAFPKPEKMATITKYCSKKCRERKHRRAYTERLNADPQARQRRRSQIRAAWDKRKASGKNAAYKKKYFQRPEARIAKSHRNRIQELIKKGAAVKSRSSLRLFGCSVAFLMAHLQERFKRGMSWNNYGSVWVVDHVIPCASFDLKIETEQVKCFHFTNLQPLFKQENAIKSDTIIPSQPELTISIT